MKAAEVDWTAFPCPKNERPAQASTHSVTSTLLESVTAWSVMGSRFGRKEAEARMARLRLSELCGAIGTSIPSLLGASR